MTQPAPQAQVLHNGPAVEHLSVSAYRVPTDLPGGDATLTWNSTTLVLVEVAAAGEGHRQTNGLTGQAGADLPGS
ncbi:hypothetical protein AB0I27_33540 [Streptomyces sp. NPDC050597]|uniref:hypothetical protein n=1 Tax=Streptomyces sp. NPDC050597 TaxID=3157212 RepID=UPI00343E7796